MAIVEPRVDTPPPPSPPTCPTCGDVALSDGVSVDRGIATNHCTDRRGHIWIVRWMVSS